MKHRLAILYDVEGWCYHSRALSLQKYAPDDFDVTVCKAGEYHGGADIVFNLDYAYMLPYLDAIYVVSWNSDSKRRAERWNRTLRHCDYMIVNNMDCWEARGRPEKTCCISNGIDTDIFKVTIPIEQRPQRVFWTGSCNPAKGKGYDIMMSAESELKRLGFETAFYPVEGYLDKSFTQAEMVDQYNQSSYVLCMSESEGTPNTSVEGMACGCVPVTTRVGNLLEYGVDGKNCIFIDRNKESLLYGMMLAKEKRDMISCNASAGIRHYLSYGSPANHAHVYFRLFRELLSGRVPAPFSYLEHA